MAAGGTSVSEHFSSRTAFLLAAIGAAVGLGNIWRFPTLAGENGGGAFVLVYILCVLLIGLPLVLAETLIGRAGGHNADAIGSMGEVAEISGRSRNWSFFAGVGMVSSFLILSFYSVVAGWVLYYVWVSGADFVQALAAGQPFAPGFDHMSQEEVTGILADMFASPATLLSYHALFMLVTLGIVASGVTGGIEKAAKWLMPAFFALLLAMVIYGALTGDMGAALAFLFTPDFSKITPSILNEAFGQACFSLSVGAGLLITYGSYIPKSVNLGSTSAMIAFADTGVAILAGLMIFPIVFSAGLDPAGGPGLIFVTLPVAFQQMPAGALVGFLFFILIFFAALTSSIALLEIPTAWVMRRFGTSRRPTAMLTGGAAFVIGIACALGYNVWADVRPLWFWPIFAENDILDSIDGVTGKIGLPLSALGVAIFIGWVADRRILATGSGLEGGTLALWRFLIAWLAPLTVGLILLFGLFPSLLA